MKRIHAFSLSIALVVAATADRPAMALSPPAAPFTLWNFLGIPQAFNKVRDASSNKFGNHPNLERKPPLKALADPQNLQSPVSSIKKAAEIKTEEDMAPQKIKAVKYLARIGCGCYGGVKEALLESLDDCTEEVRYETVLAIQDAAYQHCTVCGKNCCCDKDMTLKLSKIAYERDDTGCFLEPSERVREAAKTAMTACCPGQGGPEEVSPEQPQNEPIREPIPTPTEPTPPNEPIPPAEPSARLELRAGPLERVTESRTQILFLPNGENVVSERIEAPEEVAASPPPKVLPPRAASPTGLKKPASPALRPVGPSSRRAAIDRGFATPTSWRDESPAADADQATVRAPAKAPGAKRSAQCKVARVNVDMGEVEVIVGKGDLRVGDRLQVSHHYLLTDATIGYLEVVGSSSNGVRARPVAGLRVETIHSGDTALLNAR